MFAHKIYELTFKDRIKVGSIFEHTSKISNEKYIYEIINIELGKEKINDAIILQDLNRDTSFSVEPEWFNQRRIKFN